MKKLDGVKKVPKKVQSVRHLEIKTKQNKQLPRRQAKPTKKTFWRSVKIFTTKHQSIKIVSAIVLTFVVTFCLSIATSSSFAHAPTTQTAPEYASAITIHASPIVSNSPFPVTNVPQTLSLDSQVSNSPDKVYLPMEQIELPDPLKDRKAFLVTYLQSKHSELANHVDALSQQTQWKLILAISDAESSYCKRHLYNNCWGIGGAWNLKQYGTMDEAITDVNRILEQKYIDAGLVSTSQIEKKWVGYDDPNWEAAVNQELANLKDVQ